MPRNPTERWWLQSSRHLVSGAMVVAALCAGIRLASAEQISLRSDKGHFALRISGIDHPERVNHMHSLELSITTADGRPARGAAIALEGQRRYALNPLPTSPRVTSEPEHGRYVVEGLRFHIPGEWRLVFDIAFEHIRDRVTLDLLVK